MHFDQARSKLGAVLHVSRPPLHIAQQCAGDRHLHVRQTYCSSSVCSTISMRDSSWGDSGCLVYAHDVRALLQLQAVLDPVREAWGRMLM